MDEPQADDARGIVGLFKKAVGWLRETWQKLMGR